MSTAARIALTLFLAAIPLIAHHSFGAEYDSNKPVTLTGTITRIEWTDPHSHLPRTGWKRDIAMKVGDTVTFVGQGPGQLRSHHGRSQGSD
jgi:hypothetical protein